MYQIISTENILFNKEKAIEFLQFNNYKYQRNLREWHIKELAEKMEKGLYTGGSVVLGLNNEKISIVDGQHTLSAIILSNSIIEINLKKIFCPTDKDFTLLWQQYDGGVPRSISDYVRSEIGVLGVDWSPNFGSLMTGAAAIAVHGHTKTRLTKRDKTNLLKCFIKEGNFINSVLGGDLTIAKHIRRQPVVAVMILSYKKSKTEAFKFWLNVRDGSMLKDTAPEYHLRNFLMTSSIKGICLTRAVSNEEMFSKCAKAWNCYRKNKPMRMIRYSVGQERIKVI